MDISPLTDFIGWNSPDSPEVKGEGSERIPGVLHVDFGVEYVNR